MSKRWMNFVIFHKELIDEHYSVDPSFTHDHYTFIKTSERFPATYNKSFGYHVLFEKDFEFYDKRLQKKNYMAPSAIYHVYKNKLHEQYDFVGFLEYDIRLESEDVSIPNRITEHIDMLVSQNERIIVPYSFKHPIKRLYGQDNIMLNGRNAIEQIILDYNQFFGTEHNVNKFTSNDDLVVSQQSFLVDRKTFDHIMPFICHVIEHKLAERKNSWKRPSTLLDRYFALTVYFEELPTFPIRLLHESMHQW